MRAKRFDRNSCTSIWMRTFTGLPCVALQTRTRTREDDQHIGFKLTGPKSKLQDSDSGVRRTQLTMEGEDLGPELGQEGLTSSPFQLEQKPEVSQNLPLPLVRLANTFCSCIMT